MSRVGRASLMVFVGALIGRLVIDGGFGWFVQQRMRWPLAIAAFILLVFGAYELIRSTRHGQESAHGAGPRVGWLVALPLLVLVSVAPTALGAVAAERVDAYVPTESTSRFSELPDTGDAVPMRVIEFLDRAAWDEERSLEGRVIQLEGLVVNDPAVPDGFKLTRFMVSCCAADGIPLQVTVHGTGATLSDDTWVIADLIWRPPTVPYQETEGEWIIEADAVLISPVVGVPKDPYESPY
ncbi:MAG: TIGR03943 family protein [Actinomycetota bacterium]